MRDISFAGIYNFKVRLHSKSINMSNVKLQHTRHRKLNLYFRVCVNFNYSKVSGFTENQKFQHHRVIEVLMDMDLDLDLDDEHPFFLSFERKLLKIKSLGLDQTDQTPQTRLIKTIATGTKYFYHGFNFSIYIHISVSVYRVKLKCMVLFVAVSSIHNYGQRF